MKKTVKLIFWINKLIFTFNKDILYIFGSAFISQVGSLISSILVIRNLMKIDYGAYVAATNIYAYFGTFIGMGLHLSVMQFCSENRTSEEKNALYKYCLLSGEIFNTLLCFLIFVISLFIRHSDKKVSLYLSLFSAYPFFIYAMNYFQSALRTRRMNKDFAIANILYTIILVTGNIIFSHYIGVMGLILSLYISSLMYVLRYLYS